MQTWKKFVLWMIGIPNFRIEISEVHAQLLKPTKNLLLFCGLF